jgi:serine/threonine-protein kinase
MESGQTVAHYRILSPLGAGGMGEVFLAEDLALGRRVALKFPKASADHQRLLREARLAAKLDHPNICQVYEVGEHEGLTYVAMQYVQGQTLAQKLSRGAMSWEQAQPIALKIAEGLAEAHRLGILHRDIKPANVMLDDRGAVKVMDFGLASRESLGAGGGISSTQTMLEATASIEGTLPYMAPEQLRGEATDARTDIYAFGAMLYEMLAGKRAFQAQGSADLIAAILTREPAPLSNVPAATCELIVKCLNKSPGARPASMREVIAQLVHGTPAGQIRRSRAWVYAGALGVALAAVATSVYLAWPHGQAEIRILAVLPFENRFGDSAQDYVGEGLSSAIAADLSRIQGIRLISPAGSAGLRSGSKPPSEVGSTLGADAVLTGAASPTELSAQLIATRTGREYWKQTYRIAGGNLVAAEQGLARDVAAQIHAPLSAPALARMQKLRPVNSEAYDLYLRGRYHAARENARDIDQAIGLYQQAVDRDPAFAPALAELARACGIKSFYFTPDDPQLEERAFAAIEKAFALDPEAPEAHFARGLLLWRPSHGFAHREALNEYRRVVAVQPSFDEAWHQMGLVLFHLGRLEEALAAVRNALAINPANTLARYRAGVILLNQGKPQAAIDAFNQVPRDFTPVLWDSQWAWALMKLDRFGDAIDQLKRGLELDPRDPGGAMRRLRDAAGAGRRWRRNRARNSSGDRGRQRLRTFSPHGLLDRLGVCAIGRSGPSRAVGGTRRPRRVPLLQRF